MKKNSLVLGIILIIGLAMSTSLMADTHYVDLNGSNTSPYTTPETAAHTITAAIGAAINDDTIDVTGTITDLGITVNKDLTIQGQGASNTIVQAHATQGSASDRVFTISSGTIVTLKDMTIRYGYGPGVVWGAGLINSGALTLTNCTVSENTSNGSGGGLHNNGGTLTMTNCTVSGNFASVLGGGLHNMGGTLTMTNCTVSGNTADQDGGGGLYTQGGPATITNCTFANNSAPKSAGNGGGIFLYSNTLYIKNTIIANNFYYGTADFFNYSGTVTNNGYNIVETQNGSDFTDGDNGCIVGDGTYNVSTTLEENNTTNGTFTLKTTSGSAAINAGSNSGANNGVNPPAQDQRGAERNEATDIGAYEYWDDEGALPITLSTFYAIYTNGTPIIYWVTEWEEENEGWNIYRGENADALENNETITINSALIPGAGTTQQVTNYQFIDEQPVVEGTTYWYWLESVDFSGMTEIHPPTYLSIPFNDDPPPIPEIYGLFHNYPNPFNPDTEIRFKLEEGCFGEIVIYNMKGEKIRNLFSDKINSNEVMSVTWDGKDEVGKEVSSGVYFYQLETAEKNYRKKMLLVK
ncbi:MAG: T9SS type A sorting domain-containing protein [Candidatus Cloacimonetes bacterium]|nr:T9SS type A sorting domain-containing protein [Candidatus Cloacimonadota bacterium]